MTAKAFLAKLERCGWMKELPAAAVTALRTGVEKAIADGQEPWTGIPAVLPEDDLYPDTSKGGYAKLLREFVDLTYGLIPVSHIREKAAEGGVVVHFRYGDDRKHITVVGDDHNFYDSLNHFFVLQGSALRFNSVPDELGGFVLTSERAFETAVEKGLLPNGSEDGEYDE